MRRYSWLLTIPWALLVALVSFAACDDGDSIDEPTVGPRATVDATAAAEGRGLTESGTPPILWRTIDGFRSVQAGVPYKVVVRITEGYDEPALTLVAQKEGSDERTEFEAAKAEPTDGEPGSFYTVSIELPEGGTWRLTATAGNEAAEATFEVGEATGDPSTRY